MPINFALEVKNLTVKINNKVIIRDLSFSLPIQSFTIIIGPNGSGKTTLMKGLLDLIPTKGQVRYFGKKKEEFNFHQIGYVPQHYSFDNIFPLTVEEFLLLSLFQEKNKNHLINKALDEVQLAEIKDKKIRDLSGGQLQRLLVARAILTNPKILFLDEAVAGIDYTGVKSIYEILRHLKKDHKTTIIMISHEINLIPKSADLLICIGHNYTCQGPISKTLTAENLRKVFSNEAAIYQHIF